MVSEDKRFALFIDIDGTLTGKNHIIPKRNIDAINSVRALGHKVFINTGRSRGNIPEIILSQVEFDGILSGNGTLITIESMPSYENYMSFQTVEKIARYVFEETEYWAAFEGVEGCYMIEGRTRVPGPHQTGVKDFEECMKRVAEDKIQVIAVAKDIGKEYLDSLSEEVSYFTFDRYFDIVSKGNNKANSMFRVLDMLGIKRENSIAFGDSENDLDMLISAGTGVAMKNSMPCLLEAADFISLSNEDGGVGFAIEELLLKGE